MNEVKKLSKIASNFTVLYVEDDLVIQKSMEKYLKKLFKSVSVTNNGSSALAMFQKSKYDLVITDLSMPIIDGLEMIKRIRQIDSEQAILITSAHGEAEYMIEAIKFGIDGYIIKPFDYKQLNFELYKISNRLQKFKESALYKSHLENLIDKKSAIVNNLLSFQNENYEKTLYSMVEMIEFRDTYTAGHSKRVATYSQMIAKEMGYQNKDCTTIYQAGMLHDIGKIATPDAVLLNPQNLNDIEYKLIQEHVNVGYKILKDVPMFKDLAEIVYSHHERYDAKGYPRGIGGKDITPLARIIIVADAFDAMTTSRIYKARKSVNEALDELKLLSKKQFHPEVVPYAIKTLKDVEIDEHINQLPRTTIEKKRFAYFYEDTLTNVYNKSYLDLLLARNTYEYKYCYICIIFIHHFSAYNKKYGWASGDRFLKELAGELKDYFSNDVVFRVLGDDFVILSEDEIEIEKFEHALKNKTEPRELEYSYKKIDLQRKNITSFAEII